MSDPSVEYPFGLVPGDGEVLEVAPGVFWVRMPLPFALDHVNLWLIADGEGWAVVDTGYAMAPVRERWERVFDTLLAGRPVTRILVTHFHPDHMGLAAWIQDRWGAALLVSQQEWLWARMLSLDTSDALVAAYESFYGRAGASADLVAAMRERGNAYRRGVPQVPASFARIRNGDELAIGGNTWRVITGSGHAPEHVCLYSPELSVLISGDQVLPRISPNVGVWANEPLADPLADFLASMAPFRALAEDVLVLPSHDGPFRGLGPRLDQLARHHAERLEETLEACRDAPTAVAVAERLFRRPLDLHQTFFAVGETLAHLNHLVRLARLRREVDAAGCWRFAVS